MSSLEELLQWAEGASVAQSAPTPPPATGGVETPSANAGGTLPSLEELLQWAEKAPEAQSSMVPGAKEFSWGPEANPQRTKEMGAIQNFGAAAHEGLAHLLGYPVDTIAMVLNKVGMQVVNAKGELNKPGDTAELFKQGIRALGGNPDPDFDRFSARAGKNTFEGLVMLAAFTAAAPAVAANLVAAGWTKLSQIVAQMGKHPVTAMMQEFGAGPGATAGREFYGDKAPLGQIGGGIAGAMVGGGLLDATMQMGKAVGRAVAKTAQMLPGEIGSPTLRPGLEDMMPTAGAPPAPMPAASLRPNSADPMAITQFAQARNHGDGLLLDEAINKAIESIPKAPLRTATGPNRGEPRLPNAASGEFETTVPYAVTQNNVNSKLEAAVGVAQGMEKRAWSAVGMNQKVPGFDLQEGMNGVVKQSDWQREQLAFRPDDLVDSFNAMWAPRPDKTGHNIAQNPTVGEVKSWIDSAQLRLDQKSTSGTLNEKLVGNINKIIQVATDGLQKSFPGDVRLQQALDLSNKVRQLIHQGPVATLRGRLGTGALDVDPSLTTDTMLKTYGGVKSVLALEKELSQVPSVVGQRGAPSVVGAAGPTRPMLATSSEQQTLRDLSRSVEDSINAGFRDHAEKSGMDPAKIGKWLRDNENSVKDITTSAVKFSKVYDALEQAATVRKEISQSTFQRYLVGDSASGMDPQTVVSNIFSAKNPRGVVNELLDSKYLAGVKMRDDNGAMDGLKQSMVDHIVRTNNADPTRIYEFLTVPKNARAIEAAIGKDEYGRMTKLANTAMKLQNGEIPEGKTRAIYKGLSALGAMFGSKAASITSATFGMGPAGLIAQGAGAKVTRGFVEKRLAATDPAEYFARALTNVNDEKFLLSKIPETAKGLDHMTTLMIRAMRVQESFRQQLMDTYRDQPEGKPLRFTSGVSESVMLDHAAALAEHVTSGVKPGPGWTDWLNNAPSSPNVVDRSNTLRGSMRDYGDYLGSNPIAGQINKIEGRSRAQDKALGNYKRMPDFKNIMK